MMPPAAAWVRARRFGQKVPAYALALALSSCNSSVLVGNGSTGSASQSSTNSGSGSAASASGAGTSTGESSGTSGAAGATGQTSGSGSGSSASGGATTSSGGGRSSSSSSGAGGATTTGGACVSFGHLPAYQSCVVDGDCACPMRCLVGDSLAPSQGNGLVCERDCATAADCPDIDSSCQQVPIPNSPTSATASVCALACNLSLNPDAGPFELDGCNSAPDCPCPLRCSQDGFQSLCEKPCQTTAECGDGGLVCSPSLGVCQHPRLDVCGGGLLEANACDTTADCVCPLSCLPDPLYPQRSCLNPCSSSTDCPSPETCDLDAGTCVPPYVCGSGNPNVGLCKTIGDCICGQQCVVDSSRANATGNTFCENCDGGSCVSLVGGACQTGGIPKSLSEAADCNSNNDCDCPDRCTFVTGPGELYSLGGHGYLACRQPCQTDSDCPQTFQHCDSVAKLCLETYCQHAITVSDVAVVGALCDLASGRLTDAGQGTCLAASQYPVADQYPPVSFFQQPPDFCVPSGTSTSSCNPTAAAAAAADRCIPGEVCTLQLDGSGLCAPSCDPTDGGDCGDGGLVCVQLFGQQLPGTSNYPASTAACLAVGPGGCAQSAGGIPGASPYAGGVLGQYAPCGGEGSPTCTCPYRCTPDAVLPTLGVSGGTAGNFCELPCTSSADCPNPLSVCTGNGFCGYNPSLCSEVGTVCAAALGQGDGTCVSISSAPNTSSLFCKQGGSASQACDPRATRENPELLCSVGYDCLPNGDGGYGCHILCNPQGVDGGCSGPEPAICSPVLATLAPFDTTESSCFSIDAGCQANRAANRQYACQSNLDCACGLDCVISPLLGGSACEAPCTQASDCPLPYEFCNGQAGDSHCEVNVCSPTANPGDACDSDSSGDGTCLPQTGGDVFVKYEPYHLPVQFQNLFGNINNTSPNPLCFKAGTATGACDPLADRSDLTKVCVAGSVCTGYAASPTCTPLCPDLYGKTQSTCASGQICLRSDVSSQLAECLPARGAP